MAASGGRDARRRSRSDQRNGAGGEGKGRRSDADSGAPKHRGEDARKGIPGRRQVGSGEGAAPDRRRPQVETSSNPHADSPEAVTWPPGRRPDLFLCAGGEPVKHEEVSGKGRENVPCSRSPPRGECSIG